MLDWYRKLALGLLTALIISAVGQWGIWIAWSSRIDEQHVAFRSDISHLQSRPIAAINSAPRISVMESRLVVMDNRLAEILTVTSKIDDKLDSAIAGDKVQFNRPTRPGQN